MNAIELLEEQHRAVRGLFKKLEGTSDRAEQRQLFEEIAKSLVAHDAIEREQFYPECEAAMGMNELLGEALVEHGVVEFCLFEADQARDSEFGYKCKVLREMLDHHIDEEEDEFFPKAKKALGDERLATLGEEMESRFEEVKQSDVRAALHENLRQVLSGAMKTKPKGANASNGRKQPRKRRTPERKRATARAANGTKGKRSSSHRNGARRHA